MKKTSRTGYLTIINSVNSEKREQVRISFNNLEKFLFDETENLNALKHADTFYDIVFRLYHSYNILLDNSTDFSMLLKLWDEFIPYYHQIKNNRNEEEDVSEMTAMYCDFFIAMMVHYGKFQILKAYDNKKD